MKGVSDDAFQALALAAHELRSPGSVVSGYLRLLLKGSVGELPEAQRKVLEEANRACERILHLVHELSELAALKRPGAPARSEPLHIFAICDEVVRAMAEAEAAEITFECSAADRSAIVNGDADRLRRALESLIAAVRRERGTDALNAHGFVDRTDGASRAVIVFAGAGAASPPDEDVSHALDRWRGGMGLALPIACCIIEAHGGRVWAVPSDSPETAALSLPIVETP